LDPISPLVTANDQDPPERLGQPVEVTPFFQVGPEGFLMFTPSGGRLHYAPGSGLSLAVPPGRPEGDLLPFAHTSGFAAAAWMEGRVPLRANAVRLTDGRLLLVASDHDDLNEAMALALADAEGLSVSQFPVVIDPEDTSRVCTNGQPITMRRTTKEATEPEVRKGSRRLQMDRPVIDGSVVHACAGMICLEEGKASEPTLQPMPMMRCVAEIKRHIFMPLVGTAIWGDDTINAAHVLLAGQLPMFDYRLPPGAQPSVDLARNLLAQFATLGESA
jgi:hypothetical protein